MKKRILSTILSLALVFSMVGVTALAQDGALPIAENTDAAASTVETAETTTEADTGDISPGASNVEKTECDCTEKCTAADEEDEIEATIKANCPVCGADGADLTLCKGKAPATTATALNATDNINSWDIGSPNLGDITATKDGTTLTITGKGAMRGWSYSTDTVVRDPTPWGTDITAVIFEGDITNIGNNALYNCHSLASISIPDSVKNIGIGTFSFCTSLTSLTIPGTVEVITNDAFSSCTSLTNLTILEGVKNIGMGAFLNCSKLESVTFTGNAPDNFNDNVFNGTSKDLKIYISKGATGYDTKNWIELYNNIVSPIYVTLDKTGTQTLSGATVGYGVQPELPVTVNNMAYQPIGALSVVLSGENTDSFTLSQSSIPGLAAKKTGNFAITPKTGLGAGTYTATITVSGGNDITAGFDVSFTVNSTAPTVNGVTVTPAAPAMQQGTAQQFNAVVTGTNNPAQAVTWEVTGGGTSTSIDKNGLLTVAANETATSLIVTATSAADTGKSGTATVTVTTEPVIKYTITFNTNGGSVTTATTTTGADGKPENLPTPTRNSYRFDGWFTAASGGTAVTTDTVFTADTTIYARWTYTGGGSTGGDSSSDDSNTVATLPYSTNVEVNGDKKVIPAKVAEETAEAIAEAKKLGTSTIANIVAVNPAYVTPLTLQGMAAAATKAGGTAWLHADSAIVGGKVMVRIYIDTAKSQNLKENILLGGEVSGKNVEYTKKKLEYFDNKTVVVSLARQNPFEVKTEIAAKVDLTGLDTKSLHFYSYDRATNKYVPIDAPSYRIDRNGYLHWSTTNAGDIVITDKPLVLKK